MIGPSYLRRLLFVGFMLFAGASLSWAASRPAEPKARSSFASPVDQARVIDEMSEGQAYIRSLPEAVQRELSEKRRVLLPEEQSRDDGAMAGLIKAVALFEQPKAVVYGLIAQPSKQVLFLPRLKAATPVHHDETGELTEFHLGVGLVTVKFRTQHWWWPQYSRFEWALDPAYDNDVKVAHGFWQIFTLDDKTSVGQYGTVVDTGLPVPESLQSYFARKDIPNALEAFQKYIDSGGTYRRSD